MPLDDLEPIDVAIPGSSVDPRIQTSAPQGVRLRRVPRLHPEDVVTLPSGLRVTSVSRTLIDLAEVLTREELRDAFVDRAGARSARPGAVRRSRARVEWRPSLAMLDEVIEEFASDGILKASVQPSTRQGAS